MLGPAMAEETPTTLAAAERRRLLPAAAALARARAAAGGPPRLEPVAGRLVPAARAGLLACLLYTSDAADEL